MSFITVALGSVYINYHDIQKVRSKYINKWTFVGLSKVHLYATYLGTYSRIYKYRWPLSVATHVILFLTCQKFDF